ncbi:MULTISPECIES: hypothetical protein [unclassified Chitinophaga]|uniref:hypothetical protein n=1 Tax=unclassified Chitinophaga TaxID=2619133 RepID=UPI0015C3D4A5|nr:MULTISPECIES: hypothetical protein [unclassified Chitinophaga]WPV66020.1 hypothetical protein QQL36_29920 [Chitinophaga sp. LS1]
MKPKIIPGYDCVGEVRKIREQMHDRFNGDMRQLCAYLDSRRDYNEKKWGVKFIGDDEE